MSKVGGGWGADILDVKIPLIPFLGIGSLRILIFPRLFSSFGNQH